MLVIGIAAAFSVKPEFIEVKDSGGQNLAPLDVGITIDCDTKALIVDVSANDTGEPIADASLYLFYTQYEYQLIASGKTGANGTGVVDVIGNRDYLTRLFIFRVDKPGYKSKEIEFMYKKCFEAPPPPANNTPPANVTPPSNVTPPANTTPPANATPPAANATPPAEELPNGTGNTEPETPEAPPQPLCPAGLLLLSALFAGSRA